MHIYCISLRLKHDSKDSLSNLKSQQTKPCTTLILLRTDLVCKSRKNMNACIHMHAFILPRILIACLSGNLSRKHQLCYSYSLQECNQNLLETHVDSSHAMKTINSDQLGCIHMHASIIPRGI